MLETEDGIVLNSFHLRDVLGRNITCEDGVTRRVEQISHSYKYTDMLLINEVNEDETPGGMYVHALSLACQMTGTKLPTADQKKAFSRTMNAFRFQPEEDQATPGFIRLPSGLLVSKR
jgi:hypothetical protein